MRERVCKNCGGRSYKVVGQNMVKCRFCGTLYVDEHASKEEEVLIVGAYELLRALKFEDAQAEFEKIISLYPMSFEAYYGLALAKNKIIYYTNKKGLTKKPRFFQDIPLLSEDEDFKRAVELAPAEVSKNYIDDAKKIEKLREKYNQHSQKSDVFVYVMKGFTENEKVSELLSSLKTEEISTFLYDDQKEDEVFFALNSCKVLVFFADSKKEFFDGECKNIYDRYLYFISQRQKAKSSLILVLNEIKMKDVPSEINFLNNFVYFDSISFVEDMKAKIKDEMKKTDVQQAKIEKVKLTKENPKRKEYVDLKSVQPVELGNYEIQNVEISDINKIKWIYLTLKHGDFASAKELLENELKKDENNSELLFARLLCEKQLRTEEEFFSNINNFNDKQTIDQILKYADKDFAERFVDNWENLIISLNNEENYNKFLLYLAKFDTPNRENFINKAENIAISTQNEELIEKVEKCFDKNDVDRFINFYYTLAQISDNKKYYEKVLALDEGHEQSNLMILLEKFKTVEDKLSYRNREDVEKIFKFLSEQSRDKVIALLINQIVEVSFYDTERAQQQLDFYLSYISDDNNLCEILNDIASKFQNMGFFKVAEKYLSISISKQNSAELVWQLIKIKNHCQNDEDLIFYDVKIMQMPEWGTLLSLASESQTEKYAEIASRISLYSGERQFQSGDLLDKKELSAKLSEFLTRNEKILIEFEKAGYTSGVKYFRSQLKPFESYFEKIDKADSFDEYKSLLKKLNQRLVNLDLTLDMSISATLLADKEEVVKKIYPEEIKASQNNVRTFEKLKKNKFIKKFCIIFLEIIPILFASLLLVILLASAKNVYLYFSQRFIAIISVYSAIMAASNLIYYLRIKNRHSKLRKMLVLGVIIVGFANILLFGAGFTFGAQTLSLASVKEMQKLLKNAPYATFKLENDIDMNGFSWKKLNFYGELDGDGHWLNNLTINSGSFINKNSGEIKNLNLNLSSKTYKNIKSFGAISSFNSGIIKNCNVYGEITLELKDDSVVGGIAGTLDGGEISGCQSELKINVVLNDKNLKMGGIAGKTSKNSTIKNNFSSFEVNISGKSSQVELGGLLGRLERSNKVTVEQNHSDVKFLIDGNIDNLISGGLIGWGYSESENNYSTGNITTSANFAGNGFLGGLYGRFDNSDWAHNISHSYSLVEIDSLLTKGSLVGGLGGNISYCFAPSEIDFVGKLNFSNSNFDTCSKNFSQELGFDGKIWDFSTEYPTFL